MADIEKNETTNSLEKANDVEAVEIHRKNSLSEHKHPGGRPRKYQFVEQLQAAIDSYFESTEKVTVTGLALHLGFNSRQSLLNNEGYSEEFLDAIKRAKLRIEAYYEERLVEAHAGGAIFALKNFGWSDKNETIFQMEPPPDEPMSLEDLRELLREVDEAGNGLCTEC